MSKRLQVLLEDDELSEIHALARRRHQTTATFVREALREARSAAAYGSPEAKLRAVREAVAFTYPTGEIEDMLAETARGSLGGLPEPPMPASAPDLRAT